MNYTHVPPFQRKISNNNNTRTTTQKRSLLCFNNLQVQQKQKLNPPQSCFYQKIPHTLFRFSSKGPLLGARPALPSPLSRSKFSSAPDRPPGTASALRRRTDTVEKASERDRDNVLHITAYCHADQLSAVETFIQLHTLT